ncbi:tRNA wybutosine-synthesizing protein 2/3/4 [Euphorbia peplus]|nr:tRNA wybutosine-synthesizing protein 2/3/4 [Euphorbia peplus]
MEFEKRKVASLSSLNSPEIDEPIIPLISSINFHPSYFTTSSRSGRISILSLPNQTPLTPNAWDASWKFVSDEPVDLDMILTLFFPAIGPSCHKVFLFEPLSIDVECIDVQAAELLLSIAISSGFRESGITSVTKKRVIVGIRCSIRMEVPLGESHKLLVSEEYVKFLVEVANAKMEANGKMTQSFFVAFVKSGFLGSPFLENGDLERIDEDADNLGRVDEDDNLDRIDEDGAQNGVSPFDKLPKDTIDAPIIPLLGSINSHPSYFTTSSCSGRISIIAHPKPAQFTPNSSTKLKAPDCPWTFVSDDPVDPEMILTLLFPCPGPSYDLVFRFEPLSIVVECIDVEAAQLLVSMAISSGFKESGITSANTKKVIVGIRCPIRMEVPLGESHKLLVSQEYVKFLVEVANAKMEANAKMTQSFFEALTKNGFMGSPISEDGDQNCDLEGDAVNLERIDEVANNLGRADGDVDSLERANGDAQNGVTPFDVTQ